MKTSLAVVFLAGTVTAQASLTMPSQATLEPGTSSNYRALYFSYSGPTQGRFQNVYDTSEVGSQPLLCTQLEYRSASMAAFPIGTTATGAGLIQIDIDMSMSPVAHDQIQTTFAGNHGPNVVRVFSGTVPLQSVMPAGWPMPWMAPIVFQTPFQYDPALGSSLVIEITTHSNTAGGMWRAEEYAVTGGTIEHHYTQVGCMHSGGITPMQRSYQPLGLVPGGYLSLVFGDMPNNPSLAINSFMLGLEGVGAAFGSYTLPVDLNQLGIPAYAGCRLAVVPLAAVTMHFQLGSQTNSSYFRLQPMLPIPNDPQLVGAQLIGQTVGWDQPTSGPGQVLATQAVEINFGDPTPPLASQLYSPGSTTSATGFVGLGKALTLRLQ